MSDGEMDEYVCLFVYTCLLYSNFSIMCSNSVSKSEKSKIENGLFFFYFCFNLFPSCVFVFPFLFLTCIHLFCFTFYLSSFQVIQVFYYFADDITYLLMLM